MSILWQLLQSIPTTLMLWLGAQVLGLALAIPVAAGRMSKNRTIRIIAIWWIEIFRGIPTLVLLFIVFFGLSVNNYSPSAMVAGILGLGFSSSGYIAESIRAGFEAVPKQQTEACLALSLPLKTRLGKVLFPQALPVVSEGVVSYSIHLLKETALASLIGVVDIMTVAYYLVERGVDGPTVFFFAGMLYLIGCTLLAWFAHLVGRNGPHDNRLSLRKARAA